jgi:hypothetical protein
MQSVIWGLILGPGVLTRNPFATMWLVPLSLALTGNALLGAATGAVAGLAHGVGRASGIMRNMKRSPHYIELVLLSMRWRFIDGAILLLAAGALAGIGTS